MSAGSSPASPPAVSPRMGAVIGSGVVIVLSYTYLMITQYSTIPLVHPTGKWLYGLAMTYALIGLAVRAGRNAALHHTNRKILWPITFVTVVLPVAALFLIDKYTAEWQENWAFAQALLVAVMLLTLVVHTVTAFPIRSIKRLPEHFGMRTTETLSHVSLSLIALAIGAGAMAEQDMIRMQPTGEWQSVQSTIGTLLAYSNVLSVMGIGAFALTTMIFWVVGGWKRLTRKKNQP